MKFSFYGLGMVVFTLFSQASFASGVGFYCANAWQGWGFDVNRSGSSEGVVIAAKLTGGAADRKEPVKCSPGETEFTCKSDHMTLVINNVAGPTLLGTITGSGETSHGGHVTYQESGFFGRQLSLDVDCSEDNPNQTSENSRNPSSAQKLRTVQSALVQKPVQESAAALF